MKELVDVRIKLAERDGIFRASASITLELSIGKLVLRGYSVMEKDGKEWVNKPSKKIGTEYVDQVFGLSKDMNMAISDAIMAAYRNAKGGTVSQPQQPASQNMGNDDFDGFATVDGDDSIPF